MMFVMGALTVLSGILSSVQSGCNATLAKSLHQPLLAAFVFAAMSALTFVVAVPFVGVHSIKAATITQVPWWAWLGGVFGATYVLTAIFFAEKLGSGVFIGLVVSAEIITSLVMDHYGLVGFKEHPASWPRLLGGALMLGGLALVAAF